MSAPHLSDFRRRFALSRKLRTLLEHEPRLHRTMHHFLRHPCGLIDPLSFPLLRARASAGNAHRAHLWLRTTRNNAWGAMWMRIRTQGERKPAAPWHRLGHIHGVCLFAWLCLRPCLWTFLYPGICYQLPMLPEHRYLLHHFLHALLGLNHPLGFLLVRARVSVGNADHAHLWLRTTHNNGWGAT